MLFVFMVKELKPPCADIKHFPSGKGRVPKDIRQVREDILKLANDIDNIADQTPWPEWSRLNAKDLRRFYRQLETGEY